MIPAPTDRAAREEASGQLGIAAGAQPSELDQGRPAQRGAVDRQDRRRIRVHEHDVIVVAAVFVGAADGPPPRGEGEAAVATGQIPGISHAGKHATRREPMSPNGRPSAVKCDYWQNLC
jgi:hypothetical protein